MLHLLIIWPLAVVLALVSALGCADTGPPSATFRLYPLDRNDADAAEYSKGALAWWELGIVEDETSELGITIERWPNLKEDYGAVGLADRVANRIIIDTDLTTWQLWVVTAHEVGHIVLDTSEHTNCGVMGGRDTVLCDEDRELACRVAGFCP